MKRRLIVVVGVALALAVASAGVLYAITNGQPDGNGHPYVGVLVFDDATGPAWSCSGSLIAPNVVLTAGHCAYGAVAARVWFNSDIRTVSDWPAGGIDAIEGEAIAHPDYATRFIDVGVVILEQPVTDIEPANLPPAGIVDTLPMMANIDLVGYGVQWKLQMPGPPEDRWAWNGLRYYAPSRYIGSQQWSSSQFLKLTANPGQGKGGICFGDSGGPDVLRGSDQVLAVNSFVNNYNCAGVTYSMRIDRDDVLDWLALVLASVTPN